MQKFKEICKSTDKGASVAFGVPNPGTLTEDQPHHLHL